MDHSFSLGSSLLELDVRSILLGLACQSTSPILHGVAVFGRFDAGGSNCTDFSGPITFALVEAEDLDHLSHFTQKVFNSSDTSAYTFSQSSLAESK